MNNANMIFAFPGQGSQYVGMGKSLYSEFSVARDVFNEVDTILGRKLSNVIFNGTIEDLTITENAQPAIMAVSIAILRIMEYMSGRSIFSEYGIQYVCGHSVGEYTALCAAGALTLETTVKLLQVRSKAMHEASKQCQGGMLALLGADLSEVENVLKSIDEVCEIANDNGAGQIVVSGAINALHLFTQAVKNLHIKRIVKLQVSGPFHSSLMGPAHEEIAEFINDIEIGKPIVPIISNVTAKKETNPQVIKELLPKQVTSRVRWRETILYLINHGINQCVEIGPSKVLSNLIRRINQSVNTKSIDNVTDVHSFFNEKLLLSVPV